MAQFLLPPQWTHTSWSPDTGKVLDTTYQAGDQPRYVSLTWSGNSGVDNDRVNVLIEDADPPTQIVGASIMEQGSGDTVMLGFMVPARHYYRVNTADGLPLPGVWSELDG